MRHIEPVCNRADIKTAVHCPKADTGFQQLAVVKDDVVASLQRTGFEGFRAVLVVETLEGSYGWHGVPIKFLPPCSLDTGNPCRYDGPGYSAVSSVTGSSSSTGSGVGS